jgi:hypothetical protein
MKVHEKYLEEASASQALDRGKELKLLMGEDVLEKLKEASMKTQKQAAKIFQQAISLIKGL